MAYLRDEATRVAPHGAPGVRVLRDPDTMRVRSPFQNALRVDPTQDLLLGRPRDPCKNDRGPKNTLTRATLARLTAPRTLAHRDPRERGDLALDRRSAVGRYPRVEAAAQQDAERRRPRRGGLDETGNLAPETVFDRKRQLVAQELRVAAPAVKRGSRSDAQSAAALRATIVALSKRGSTRG